ncbi:Hypothetical predicted protein [Pelobates cultripes]|uniref:Distal membrane-arm assembly complex protein 1-like domain-containing protein n=1 Tax=Pelobates cultripes TaxID=61616 RepID=A0AAD1WWE1_PELCU|nr:Hypothetical predicted protein [Pelobates cultripes]
MSSTTETQPSPARPKFFGDCWSCRILSGSGLIAAGGYVYLAARKTLRMSSPTSMGTVAQIMFALCLASWGTIIIVDPVGRAIPVEKVEKIQVDIELYKEQKTDMKRCKKTNKWTMIPGNNKDERPKRNMLPVNGDLGTEHHSIGVSN